MSKLPGWLGRVGAELTELGTRLEERRAAAEAEADRDADAEPAAPAAADHAAATADHVPPPPAYAPSVAARPDPVAAIPWGMRVAAEAAGGCSSWPARSGC